MTSQSHATPEDPPDDAFGDPARSLAVPDPAWLSEPGEVGEAVAPVDPPSPLLQTNPSPARLDRDDIPSGPGEPWPAAWHSPPAVMDASADPYGEAALDTQFSHLGLTTVDPWAPVQPWYHAIWPWGWGGIVETVDVLVLALVMFMGVRFMAHNYIVDGASMSPTFEDSDFLIVNRLAYRTIDLSWIPGVDMDPWQPFGTPQPGDVVVFHFQPATSDRDFIKRVIAVPGQTVHVTGGYVHVDGVRLDESYIAQPPNYELAPTTVEEGTVFVLGDNRNNSYDSHAFGAVDQETLVGRADFRYWPATRWGFVEHVIGNGQQLAGRALGGMASIWP